MVSVEQRLGACGAGAEQLDSPLRARWRLGTLLMVGAVLALLGTGEPYSIALAAWFSPVFLLRFVRSSRVLLGLGSVLLVGIAASVLWSWKIAVVSGLPMAAMALSGAVTVLPYVFDRLVGSHLHPLLRLALFPSVIACLEFAVIRFSPFGTIHGLLVDTQVGNLPLLQLISVIGPYGVGFLIGLFATVVNYVWEQPSKSRRVALAGALSLLVILAAGSARLSFSVAATNPAVRIAGITPDKNIVTAQYAAAGYVGSSYLIRPPRFNPDRTRQHSDAVLDDLFSKTQMAAHAGAKIVMWSEAAAAISEANMPEFISKAQQVAKDNGIYLEVTPNVYRQGQQDLNQSMMIGPEGKVLWTYIKTHPVPGQEDQSQRGGTPVPVVSTPYGRLSSVICFDGDFPALLNVDADIMLIPAADWPQDSPMHTQLAALRGIENGYAVVRTDSTGQSAAFDNKGRVLSVQDTTGADNDEIWYVDVPTRGASTIYRAIGDTFAWLSILTVLTLMAMAATRTTPDPPRNNEPTQLRRIS